MRYAGPVKRFSVCVDFVDWIFSKRKGVCAIVRRSVSMTAPSCLARGSSGDLENTLRLYVRKVLQCRVPEKGLGCKGCSRSLSCIRGTLSGLVGSPLTARIYCRAVDWKKVRKGLSCAVGILAHLFFFALKLWTQYDLDQKHFHPLAR